MPTPDVPEEISEHSSEESSDESDSHSVITIKSCYSEIILDSEEEDNVFTNNNEKWRLSVNDIYQFKDLKIEEIKEFHEMLVNEHWDYGMPKLEK